MFLEIFALFGFYTLPVWGIVFCLNLIAIIEKIKAEEAHQKNTVWFTVSFVFIIMVIAVIAALA